MTTVTRIAPEQLTNEPFVARRRKKGAFSPVVVILIVVLLGLVAPPLVYLAETSFYTTTLFGGKGEFTYEYWTGLAESPLFWRFLWNTLIYSLGSAFLAIVLGVSQAWIVERTDTPGRQYVFLLSVISIGIPGVLYVVAWILIFGRAGPVNAVLMALTGSTEPVLNVFSMWGMIVIEAINWAPLAFLLVSSVFRSADASFEEASVMSGATIPRTFWDITLKLAMPAVLALALLITIRAFESFEIPALVGLPGKISVMTTEIYLNVQYSTPPNNGQASAYSLALLAVVSVMLFYYGRLTRRSERFQTITGKGFRPRPLRLGRLRYVTAGFLVLFFVVIVVMPIGILIWTSLLPALKPLSLSDFSIMTLENYRKVLGTPELMAPVKNTMLLGAGTATFVSVFTVICAWFVVRKYRGAWAVDQLATLPLVLPSIVLGVAILQVYLAIPLPLYGTLLSIIIAAGIRYLPYGMRYGYAGIIQIHTELEEASATSGASQATTFLRIVVPLVAPAITTCWLFIFLLTVGTVSLPILLVGPNTSIVAVVLFYQWENGSTLEVAALGLVWTAFTTVVSAIYFVLARRWGVGVR